MNRTASQTKRELAREALQSVLRLRTLGVQPTAQAAPVLMGLWQHTRDTVVQAGPKKCPLVLQHLGLKCLLDVVWTASGDLQRFALRDCRTGALLLAGDALGPLLLPVGAVPARPGKDFSTLNAGDQPA
jgi:hypothetical protein